MITWVKSLIKAVALPAIYVGGLLMVWISIFRNAKYGLFLLVYLIPQPNFWHKFSELPLGKDFLDILFIGVLVGMFFQQRGLSSKRNGMFLLIYILYSYSSLWVSSIQFNLPLPISTENILLFKWKNYAQMIFFYYFAFFILKKQEDQKVVVMLMSFTILLLGLRSFRNFSSGASFSYDKRDGGPFWAVGLGANHYGAFLAHYCSMIIGFYLFSKRKIEKLFLASTAAFAIPAMLFTYSRGAYAAFGVAVTFFGIVKKRSLLLLMILFLVLWQVVLPDSVVDRITMTTDSSGTLESSASHRLILWDYAWNLFKSNPVLGAGLGGFGINMPEGELKDTHNYYFLALCEQGLVGLALFLSLLYRAGKTGWDLFRKGSNDFQKGIGLGLAGCVTALIITNMFGDRWSYFTLNCYFWICWGIADRILYQLSLQVDKRVNS